MPWGTRTRTSATRRAAFPRLEAARGAERALQAQGRRHPAAEQPVGLHGVGDLHAPAERLGVVEGHLVPGHIGPHLQQARPGVTRARARDEHAQRERGGRGGAEHERRLQTSRRRTSGAATPATSTVTAAARTAVERRTQASVVRESRRPHTAARTLPAMETVILERRGGELRITLNRPDTMNAWDKQLGTDLLAPCRKRPTTPCAPSRSPARAARSPGADLRAGFDPTPEGHPDVLTLSTSATTRSSGACASFPSRCWPPSTAPRSGSAARSRSSPT